MKADFMIEKGGRFAAVFESKLTGQPGTDTLKGFDYLKKPSK